MSGELIRIVQAHMDKYGVSEAEVARRIGTTPQTVNSWRNGEMKQLPRQRYLQALAELTATDYLTVLVAALIDINYLDRRDVLSFTRTSRRRMGLSTEAAS